MEIACEMKGRGQPRFPTQLAPASSLKNSQKYAFIMDTRS